MNEKVCAVDAFHRASSISGTRAVVDCSLPLDMFASSSQLLAPGTINALFCDRLSRVPLSVKVLCFSLSLLPSARAAQSSRAGTGRASFREQQAVALHRSPFHNESGGFPWHAYYCPQCSGTSLALKGKVHRSHSQRFPSLTCRLCFPFPFTDSNDDRLSCQIFVRCPTVRLPVDR